MDFIHTHLTTHKREILPCPCRLEPCMTPCLHLSMYIANDDIASLNSCKNEIMTCKLHKTAAHDMLASLCVTLRLDVHASKPLRVSSNQNRNKRYFRCCLAPRLTRTMHSRVRSTTRNLNEHTSLASLIEHKNSTKQQVRRRLATQFFPRRVSAGRQAKRLPYSGPSSVETGKSR